MGRKRKSRRSSKAARRAKHLVALSEAELAGAQTKTKKQLKYEQLMARRQRRKENRAFRSMRKWASRRTVPVPNVPALTEPRPVRRAQVPRARSEWVVVPKPSAWPEAPSKEDANASTWTWWW